MAKSQASNIAQVKRHNRSLVMNRIVQERAISRVDLSRSTGLSKGGISAIISELLSMGLITEKRSPKGNPGRVPYLLELSTERCFLIAVDLKRIAGIVSLVDLQGNVRMKKRYDFTLADSPTTILRRICGFVTEIVDSQKDKNVVGIGVVSPGPVNIEKGVVRKPHNFPGWSDVPIRDIVAEQTGAHVVLENVANAYGVAEKYYGKGRKYRNFITIVVDDGIGSGIIMENKLFRGSRGYCNEFGHISIEKEGLKCTCGNVGCVEMYATLPRVVAQLEQSLDIGAESTYFSEIRATRHLTWDDILHGLDEGDMLAIRLLQKEAELLGTALVSAVNLLEPEAVILSSLVAQAKDAILEPLKSYVRDRIVTRSFECPEIMVSEIQDASLAGAAAIVFEHFINHEFGEYEDVLPRTRQP